MAGWRVRCVGAVGCRSKRCLCDEALEVGRMVVWFGLWLVLMAAVRLFGASKVTLPCG